MFGNAMGWVISAVLAAVGAYGGYQLLLISQPTQPTGWVQRAIKPIDLTDAVTAVLPPMTDPKDDAGDLYRQAIADYDGHATAYKEMQSTREFDESQVAGLKGFDYINQAVSCSTMHLYSNHPDEVVGYASEVVSLEKLTELKTAMSNVILLAKHDKNYAVATKFAQGLASMGYRLYKERVAVCELQAGEDFLGTGITSLISIASEEHAEGKLALLGALETKRQDEFKNYIEPVRQVITSEGQVDIGRYAGDMFQIAEDPTIDHVWRVEAIRKLGRLQFNAEKEADQLKAPKLLKRMAADMKEDPIIRATAIKARDMTTYDNQSQR